ncbi:MAG: hypothetical protein JW915_11065 [Chitinispirillaceae bacterium]|nr:hypothetical protein [Chitinispirillaceae bacterium]
MRYMIIYMIVNYILWLLPVLGKQIIVLGLVSSKNMSENVRIITEINEESPENTLRSTSCKVWVHHV